MVVSLDSSVGLHRSSDTTAAYLIPPSSKNWGICIPKPESMTPILQVHIHTHVHLYVKECKQE